MSGATTAIVIGSAISAAATIYSGQQQAGAQKKANAQALQQAETQAKAADEATNRANQKRANVSSILEGAAGAGRGGVSGTMLTGTAGAAPDANLGKSTLLGM